MASTPPAGVGDLETPRLVLRRRTDAETAAIAGTARGERARPADWAADFPDAADVEFASWDEEAPDPFGFRLVVERESGLAVGSIGLESGGSQAELFCGIVPSRRGRGYAVEAVRAVAAHAFAGSETEAVFAFAETANPAALQMLQRAGFADNGFPAVDGATVYELRREQAEHRGW